MFIRCSELLFVVLTISWLERASSFRDSSNNLLLDELTKSCPSDGIPVCGIRHKQFFLFSNDCLFEGWNKDIRRRVQLQDKTNFKKVPLKYCMNDCQFTCANVYQPVCARNFRTSEYKLFSNQCEMIKFVCETNMDYLMIPTSECQSQNTLKNPNKTLQKRSVNTKSKRRPIPCKNVFNPVCGSYMGVKSSFRNECILNAENVKFNRDWTIVKEGVCAEDYANARQHTEKITNETDPIKRRSYESNYYHQYRSDDTKYQSKKFVDNKNPSMVLPNNLYVYLPPAFQTQFMNKESSAFHDPMPVNEVYDEELNKINGLISPENMDDRLLEDKKEEYELGDSGLEQSLVKPLPFAINGHNLNFMAQPLPFTANRGNQNFMAEPLPFSKNRNNLNFMAETNFAHEINRESLDIEETSVIQEGSTENYKFEDMKSEGKITKNEEILESSTSGKSNLKQRKREKDSEVKMDCLFGSTPICGMLPNGSVNTFNTICEMMDLNVDLKNTWTKLHEGPCDNCQANCSREYEPICVTRNGVNYTMVNDCYYNMGICMDKKSKWVKLSDGECKRYTRIPDKYINSKPGFPYTSNYFVSDTTTPMPGPETKSKATITYDWLKYPKRKQRKLRRSSCYRSCKRNNKKCNCWPNMKNYFITSLTSYESQTESHIMSLVKDKA